MWAIALWLPLIFVIRGVAGYLNTYLIQLSGVRILEEIRLDYFRKLQSLPLAFFHRLSTGELISRGLNDTNQLQNTLTVIANDLIKQPATLVSAVARGRAPRVPGAGRSSWSSSACSTVPLAVFPIRYVGKKLVSRRDPAPGAGRHDHRPPHREPRRGEGGARLRARAATRSTASPRLTGALVRANMKVVKYAQALTPSIEILSAFGISITFVYAYRDDVHSWGVPRPS